MQVIFNKAQGLTKGGLIQHVNVCGGRLVMHAETAVDEDQLPGCN